MEKSRILYYGVMFFGVFIAGIAQILLKKAAGHEHKSWLGQYLNRYVVSGYTIMVLSTVCTLVAMKQVPLSTTPVWNSFGIIWATLWGVTIFNEKMSRRKIWGIALIILGIILFSI